MKWINDALRLLRPILCINEVSKTNIVFDHISVKDQLWGFKIQFAYEYMVEI